MKLKEIKKYYDNGQLNQHYYKDENDLLQGEYKKYWRNGNMSWKCYYKDGKLNGICKVYDNDDSLWKKSYYIEDKEVSKKEYYRNIVNDIK